MKKLTGIEAKSYAKELLAKHYGIKVEEYSLMDLANLVDEIRFYLCVATNDVLNLNKENI